MHLTNEVVLSAAPEKLFALLNDVDRVAPCMPGASLEGTSEDGTYRGRVKVKVGPISAAYSGTVRYLEVDESDGRLVLDAKGADEHGSGNAEAKVQVRVRPHEQGSVLALDTDLVVRGKVAQFGRGALGDVSQKLMEQFARNLTGLLAEGPPRAAATQAPTPERHAPTEAAVDGLSLVALPMAKRIVPLAAALAVGVIAGRLLGKRPGRVLADETMTATLHMGSQRHTIPVRRVTSLLDR
jgi:carbon monoxide dehydrogenase subunit G